MGAVNSLAKDLYLYVCNFVYQETWFKSVIPIFIGRGRLMTICFRSRIRGRSFKTMAFYQRMLLVHQYKFLDS